MKTTLQIFGLIAAVALGAGCAHERQYSGAAAESDQDVLTGGPVTGTRLADLPPPVRNTIRLKAPHAEIADIDKTTRYGQSVYVISFTQPAKNPKVYVNPDGTVLDVDP